MTKTNQAGFTGVELLVVLVVAIILGGLIISSLRESQAQSRDLERRVDINHLQLKLEQYWYENNSYPADLGATDIGADPNSLIDPAGETITSQATDSSNQPSSGYAFSQPTTSQYTYQAYNCTIKGQATSDEASQEETEEQEAEEQEPANTQEQATSDENDEANQEETVEYENCTSYVLYGWLELVENNSEETYIPYTRNSLN